jgi:hypothetical protein
MISSQEKKAQNIMPTYLFPMKARFTLKKSHEDYLNNRLGDDHSDLHNSINFLTDF